MGNHNIRGYKLSEEVKRKISEANKQYYQSHPGPRLGSVMPDYIRNILNEINKVIPTIKVINILKKLVKKK